MPNTMSFSEIQNLYAPAPNHDLGAYLKEKADTVQASSFDALLGAIGRNDDRNGKSSAQDADNGIGSLLSLGSFGGVLGANEMGLGGSPLYPDTLNNRAALEAAIGSAGPLPTFLRRIVSERGFTPEQTQSLYDITARHMNMENSLSARQQLSAELREAGLA